MKARALLTALVAMCAVAARANAEDTSALQSLLDENVVTTASRTPESASAAPATTVTITAEELDKYGIRTLAEAVNFLSLGVFTSNPLRTPDIGSRGVVLANDDGKHVLLLIDGHAVNDPLYGAARFDQGAGIPLDLVDHIEVIVGPGSVLYGSNAMLGVINVITKQASNYRGGHVFGEFEPGRSWHTGAGAGVQFDLFGTPSELTLGVDYYERFGPSFDFSEQRFTPTGSAPIANLTFREGGAPDGVWGGRVAHAYFTEAPQALLHLRSGAFQVSLLASSYRRGVPYSTATTDVFFDSADSYERDRALRLDVRHDARLSSKLALSSRLYADSFGYRSQVSSTVLSCAWLLQNGCKYLDVGQARWLGVEEQLSLDWLGNGSLITAVGIDVRERWVRTKQDGFTGDGAPFGPTTGLLDTQGSLTSPYVQQTYAPARWLDLNAGARLDIDNRFSPVLSPRGAFTLSPGRGTIVKGIYSEAFRAPTWAETELANYRVAPVGSLQPETVRSVEASISQPFGAQRVFFGVFRSWWKDMVVAEPLSDAERSRMQVDGTLPIVVPFGIVQYRNVASVDNYGWNGGFQGAILETRLHYGVNATAAFTRRKRDERSEPLSIAPNLFGNVHVAYASEGYVPSPALVLSYASKRLDDRPLVPSQAPSRAPALLELRFTLTGKVPIVSGLQYRASAVYASTAQSPYVAGPNSAAEAIGFAPAPLARAPIDQFSAFIGLRYDFFTGSQGAESP